MAVKTDDQNHFLIDDYGRPGGAVFWFVDIIEIKLTAGVDFTLSDDMGYGDFHKFFLTGLTGFNRI